MPVVQDTYSENMRPGLPGMLADMRPQSFTSFNVEAATLAFGVAVFQGTRDNAGRVKVDADTITDFLGISVRERGVFSGDGFVQYESGRAMGQGAIWVTAAVAVAAGDPVAVTSAGAWSNVAGTNGLVIPNARWDTTTLTTNKLARISIK